LRAPLDILFLVCCVALTADVLVPEIWGNGKTKDYPLWFWAGQQVLGGGDLYPSDPNAYFDFIYPPLPAVLLAIPSYFGKVPLYIGLSLLNAAAWWITAQLSNAMTGSGRIPGMWLAALPGFVTVTFVFDMFDLGQPNLVLLAMMLFGFWSLQHGRPWLAGGMFALATAIKVFPVAVFPYLVWRRQWGFFCSWCRLPCAEFNAMFPSSRPGLRGWSDPVPSRGLDSAPSRTGRGSTSPSSR
jgi:hypothetical protein